MKQLTFAGHVRMLTETKCGPGRLARDLRFLNRESTVPMRIKLVLENGMPVVDAARDDGEYVPGSNRHFDAMGAARRLLVDLRNSLEATRSKDPLVCLDCDRAAHMNGKCDRHVGSEYPPDVKRRIHGGKGEP